MGAPTVGIEKLDSDQAEAALLGALEAYRAAESSAPPGSSSASIASGGAADAAAQGTAGSTAAAAGAGLPKAGRRDRCFAAPLAAVMAGEVGGGNGIEPLVVGARLGLPVVDGDLMGRAFPELQARLGRPCQPASVGTDSGAKGRRSWGTPEQEKVSERCRPWGCCAAVPCPAVCDSPRVCTCATLLLDTSPYPLAPPTQMMTSAIYGVPVVPAALADEKVGGHHWPLAWLSSSLSGALLCWLCAS